MSTERVSRGGNGRPVPAPVHPAAGRPADAGQPGGVRRPPDQLRLRRAAHRAARRVLCAAGGPGLIITEEHSTHAADQPYEKLIQGWRPEVIPGSRRITGGVHAHGVPVLTQLNHNGGQSSGMYSRRPVQAPSPVPDPLFREVPKPVEPFEIAEIVAGYARVARHCAGDRKPWMIEDCEPCSSTPSKPPSSRYTGWVIASPYAGPTPR